MPISGQYTWSETDDHVEVSIPLKGQSAKKVDVFTASTILKVSYAPFLLDLNLFGEIDEERSKAALRDGTLLIRLAKKTAQPWGRLVFEGSEREVKQRRQKALKERDDAVQRKKEEVASRKVDEERMVFRKHMELEERERRRIDHIKATEKKKAEDDVHDTFSRMKNDDHASGATALDNVSKTTDNPQDCQDEEVEFEPEALPPPRNSARLTFRHTPRLLKTPSRESTVKQEQEFIMKNRSNLLKKNALLNDINVGDVDPAWLSAKGDEFLSKGDTFSAVNAYSEALAVDGTLVNALGHRAACYLRLREGECCIKDCSAALALNDVIESEFDTLHEQTQFRKKMHIRLAMGYSLEEDYLNGMEQFQKVLGLDQTDGIAVESIRYLETLNEATRLKNAADSAFAEVQLSNAMDLYSEALEIHPNYIKALMNRAACNLAMKENAHCIDDCTRALQLISDGGETSRDYLVIARVLFPLPRVQRKWSVVLLCRRAEARRISKDLQGALVDLEEARGTIRRGDDVDVEAVEKSLANLKTEMA